MQKGILVVPLDQDPLIFVEKGMERAVMETPLAVTPIKNDKEIKKILSDKHILKGKAGLELDVVPVSIFERLKRVIGFERYADISEPIKEVRAIKSPFELAQIHKSGEMLSHVFAKARDEVREGRTELGNRCGPCGRGEEDRSPGFPENAGYEPGDDDPNGSGWTHRDYQHHA